MVRIAAAVCITAILTGTNTFRDKQQKYKRVAEAYLQKEGSLKSMFRSKGMDYNTFRMCVVIYKKEQRLKVFIKGDGGEPYSCLKDYAICFSSGELGPKRQQGDFQVPEGFYYINRFNPVSSFHLSLGINYPNASDRTLGKSHPGGDIFIHGSCVSIGCVPITDDKIKELYVLAVEAKTHGQAKIPVYIFPCIMDAEGMEYLHSMHSPYDVFWDDLQKGWEHFILKKKEVHFTISDNGRYVFH